ADDVLVLDRRLVKALGVTQDYLEREVAAEREEIARRRAAYRGQRLSPEVAGRTAVVVDDGVATGGTAVAALRWARFRSAAKVILAVPVAPREAVERLSVEADRVVVLATPEPFYAVGQWYD